MKALVIAGALMMMCHLLHGQDEQRDFELVLEKLSIREAPAHQRSFFLFHFYQKHLSNQILKDCIYDQSCSEFSKLSFAGYGLFKGLFLTADRLTRCNRATFAETSPALINLQGKVIDHWDDYQ